MSILNLKNEISAINVGGYQLGDCSDKYVFNDLPEFDYGTYYFNFTCAGKSYQGIRIDESALIEYPVYYIDTFGGETRVYYRNTERGEKYWEDQKYRTIYTTEFPDALKTYLKSAVDEKGITTPENYLQVNVAGQAAQKAVLAPVNANVQTAYSYVPEGSTRLVTKKIPIEYLEVKQKGRCVIGLEGTHTLEEADILIKQGDDGAAIINGALADDGIVEVMLLDGTYASGYAGFSAINLEKTTEIVIPNNKTLTGAGNTTI
jgi:hypothetical protein